ncbi:MAG: nucleotidyl transferase AbiEii/AbiGii toxin family protein [Flavobacteriaceae bacterium]|jgi:predicted nucleotidyltransferase component of viral defense system|nr:nucleotidyl transferase AbiEii/AbiGii toxin family protein [Flavobacteriaceae bacterium]
MIFNDLSRKERLEIYQITQDKLGLSGVIIEKDWWVTAVLRALFSLPYAESLSFKGGTSLSKCWGLIERFSEDIDIAVNREYLGFTGTLSKTQISDRLRRVACSFVREKLQFDLVKQLEINGISPDNFSIKVNITPISTTDPEIIEVEYQSLFEEFGYIKRRVIVEVSGRSMSEPLQLVQLQSIIDEEFPKTDFTEKAFELQAVVPQRTFIEKICLLHEEFAQSIEFMRTERMSRHLYDLVQIMDTSVATEALTNKKLYSSVVEHRRIFVGLKEFDYSTLAPQSINIIPPANIIDLWRTDYEIMQSTMIYGDTLPFNELIDKIKQLNERVNHIVW